MCRVSFIRNFKLFFSYQSHYSFIHFSIHVSILRNLQFICHSIAFIPRLKEAQMVSSHLLGDSLNHLNRSRVVLNLQLEDPHLFTLICHFQTQLLSFHIVI